MHWQRVGVVVSAITALCMLGLLCDLSALTSHKQHLSSKVLQHFFLGNSPTASVTTDPSRRAKAAIVVLARNSDLDGVLLSMHHMEHRFNRKYRYPYVFLNEGKFDHQFKQRTSASTQSRTLYGKIPAEHWGLPEWLDQEQFDAARVRMKYAGVLYGDKASYHFMCRFYSGFFQHHPLLQEFDYYWRMEPNVYYYCDLDYDPFLFMEDRGIQYGFTITISELANTIPSLWNATQVFMQQNAHQLPQENVMEFVTSDEGDDYNLCHFWSNFEIGSFQFLRSKEYQAYFEHLDKTNGFFMERWGDAPVHSLGVAMLLNKSQVHHFQDIGYRHDPLTHCPARLRNNCACDPIRSADFSTSRSRSCHQRWTKFLNSV